jgi:hypothetical protein
MISTGHCLGTTLFSSADRVLGQTPEDQRVVNVHARKAAVLEW